MYLVIHPQDGSVCDALRAPVFWPDEGFSHDLPFAVSPAWEGPRIWPVPELVGAKLVTCAHCGKAGICPRTARDAARYIPGAVLDGDGASLTLRLDITASFPYPRGTGADEPLVPERVRRLAYAARYGEETDTYTWDRVADAILEAVWSGALPPAPEAQEPPA